MAPHAVEDGRVEVLEREEAIVPSLRRTERSHLARWTWMCGIVAVVVEIVAVVTR